MTTFLKNVTPQVIFFTMLIGVIVFISLHLNSAISTSYFCQCKSNITNISSPVCADDQNVVKLKFLHSRPFCMRLLSNDIVSASIRKNGLWAPQVTKLISLLLAGSPSKPAVFVDIGANIGWFTLVMSALGHHVIAIEPMINNVKLMKDSLQESLLWQNVTVYPHGLGVNLKECYILSSNLNFGDGILKCGKISAEYLNASAVAGYLVRQVIQVTRFDALVRQNIDVIKIDVEGDELFAIQSGKSIFDNYEVRHIISEFSPFLIRSKKADPYEYLNFFVSRGYNIRSAERHIGDMYEKNTWHTLPTYTTEQQLRKLIKQTTTSTDLWFSKI